MFNKPCSKPANRAFTYCSNQLQYAKAWKRQTSSWWVTKEEAKNLSSVQNAFQCFLIDYFIIFLHFLFPQLLIYYCLSHFCSLKHTPYCTHVLNKLIKYHEFQSGTTGGQRFTSEEPTTKFFSMLECLVSYLCMIRQKERMSCRIVLMHMEFARLFGLIFLIESAAGQYQTRELILVSDLPRELTLVQDQLELLTLARDQVWG